MTKPSPSKSYLVIFNQSPYCNFDSKNQFEFSLAASAMGCRVSCLFMEDGVYNLTLDLNGEAILRNSFTNGLKAYDHLEIGPLYVLEPCLKARGLSADNLDNGLKGPLVGDTEVITYKDFVRLSLKFDVIIS